MDLNGQALRGLLRGLRTGDPGLILGAGAAIMILWLRRNPKQRELVASYDLRPGQAVTIVLREQEIE